MHAHSLEEHLFLFFTLACQNLHLAEFWKSATGISGCFSNHLSWASHVSLSIRTVFYSITVLSEIPHCWFCWNGIQHLLTALLLVRQFYTLTSTDMCGHELALCIQKLGSSLAEGEGGLDGGGSIREGETQNIECLSCPAFLPQASLFWWQQMLVIYFCHIS